MRLLRNLFFSIIIVATLLIDSSAVYAWGWIAHYSIGIDSGYDPDQICMSLPDAWPNREWIIVITKWFSWTHAVQTTGYSTMVIPNIPIYPNDGRDPGYDMYLLTTKKRKTQNQNAINTAYAFIGHNAMDQVVHYDYFLGGSYDNWVVQHGQKEEWVDYELYYSSEYVGGAFDSEGKSTTFFGTVIDHNNPNQVLIPCTGNAEIIQIAQKAYRKNRRFTASDNSGYLDEIDTIGTINGRIADLQQEINDEIRQLNYERFQELRSIAIKNNWNLDDVESHYEKAKTKVRERISGAGN